MSCPICLRGTLSAWAPRRCCAAPQLRERSAPPSHHPACGESRWRRRRERGKVTTADTLFVGGGQLHHESFDTQPVPQTHGRSRASICDWSCHPDAPGAVVGAVQLRVALLALLVPGPARPFGHVARHMLRGRGKQSRCAAGLRRCWRDTVAGATHGDRAARRMPVAVADGLHHGCAGRHSRRRAGGRAWVGPSRCVGAHALSTGTPARSRSRFVEGPLRKSFRWASLYRH